MSKSDQDEGVRNRVIKHLGGLLLPVLGVGACTKETPPVVCDPMPPPSGSLSDDVPAPSATSTVAPSATQESRFAVPPADPPPPPPPPVNTRDPRYDPPVVCDPMPPPPMKK
jgi:hypothetical protein